MEQAIVVGAGPCGLAAAIELQNIGLNPLVIEKYNIVHSIYRYPTNLQFFSTAELLEIADIPFSTPNEKPFRREALEYYRNVAQRRNVRLHTYEEVVSVSKEHGRFIVTSERKGKSHRYEAATVVVATGYFDRPNMIGIPGETLEKVSHYFQEPHPYAGTKVAIIGGNNSAVDAAMELVRVGADVTIVYRGTKERQKIKPWVSPLFEGQIAKGKINMLYESRVIRIAEDTITVENPDGSTTVMDNDFVLALTGFRPDRVLLGGTGAELREDTGAPVYDPETMETSVKGLYVAGVVASGEDANEIFIESGRKHGTLIARHIAAGRP
ncbi:YpdA family putative bacillithiol disulfide reductase [Paenibacillus thermotolerans]|uniref:YpdA family putative bacillithiol disulfide reductase n=1 Tax=Paenibacillus thermotolerans TaxID=3027807 RepID=UPI002367824D|nr:MULTISPECIES: YpdA family putative bacillithiol disulfide reductase [unclassified Paenibacillus]